MQLCGVGKEDSEAIKARGRTWHHNKEQDFIMLSAVQTDLDAALFPKNLQAEQPKRNLLLHTLLGWVCRQLQPQNRGQGLEAGMRQLTFYWLGIHR